MQQTLQDVLNSQIPLTNSIGIQVEQYDDHSLTLSAPLENNLNHKLTAFGGSLYSVAVLSGWGLVYLIMKENNLTGHIVIQQSNTRYIKPVVTDIRATCSIESEKEIEQFIKIYQRKGRARLKLQSKVVSKGDVCVIFDGTYVVHK